MFEKEAENSFKGKKVLYKWKNDRGSYINGFIRKDGLHLGDYYQWGDGDIDCQSWCDYPSEEEIQDDSVIAWKEIVLPELPKEIE